MLGITHIFQEKGFAVFLLAASPLDASVLWEDFQVPPAEFPVPAVSPSPPGPGSCRCSQIRIHPVMEAEA